jgi:uncharacterized protein (DUF1810 family)
MHYRRFEGVRSVPPFGEGGEPALPRLGKRRCCAVEQERPAKRAKLPRLKFRRTARQVAYPYDPLPTSFGGKRPREPLTRMELRWPEYFDVKERPTRRPCLSFTRTVSPIPMPPTIATLPLVEQTLPPVEIPSVERTMMWHPNMPAPPPTPPTPPTPTTIYSADHTVGHMMGQLGRLSIEERPDTHNIGRFIGKHQEHFDTALTELEFGRKVTHWSWYLIPTPPFDGGSGMNQFYSLDEAAAQAYLLFPETNGVSLRKNYLTIMRLIGDQLEQGISLVDLVGEVDAPKVLSSAHFFELITFCTDNDDIYQVCNRLLRLA